MRDFWPRAWIGVVCGALLQASPLWAAGFPGGAGGFLLVPQAQQVQKIDLTTGKAAVRLNVPVANVFHNAAFTADGTLLAAGDASVSLIGPDGRLVGQLALPDPVVEANLKEASSDIPVLQPATSRSRHLIGVGYSPRTRTAYLGVRDEEVVTLYRIDPQAKSVQVFATIKEVANPRDLVVTADGLRIYLSSVEVVPEPAGRLYSINPITGAVGEPLAVAFDPTRPQMATSRDGNLLFVPAADESLLVVNTRSNSVVRRIRLAKANQKGERLQRVLSTPDDRHLWVATNRRLVLWDALDGVAVAEQPLAAQALDVSMGEGERVWSLHPAIGGKPATLRVWDGSHLLSNDTPAESLKEPEKDRLPPIAQFTEAISGANRLLVADSPVSTTQNLGLPRVAVVGFDTGEVRYGRYPNIADVISGDLLWTRRYEIVSPIQVKSVLASLDLAREQLGNHPEAIRQVATLLGADIILVGAPLRVNMPNRNLEALSSFISPTAAFLVPQFFSPQVFSTAEAFDQSGKSLWKGDVVNSDSAFFAGKTDTVLLANAMVITAHDIANKFSNGVYNEIKANGFKADLPPLLKNDALKDVRRVALLGPDSALFNDATNSPESLGQLIAPRLAEALGWQVEGPDEALSRLADLGIEPAQILTTDPKLLARALGVDAVMLGLVRSSTYVSGSVLGLSQNAAADVVLQFELVDRQGRVLWKDIQVRNIAEGAEGGALRQAAKAVVERLQIGLKQAQAPASEQKRS